MDLTTQRRLLKSLTAGFLVVAAGGVVWSMGGIDESSRDSAMVSGSPKTSIQPDNNPESGSAADKTDQVDLSLPLQKSLYDPPKPEPPKPKPVVVRQPTKPKPKKPRLDWTLTGTIIDPGRSLAILTDATGKTDIRSAGEEVELSPPGVLVRKIDSDKVTLEIQGDQSTLRLKQSFQSGNGGNPDRRNRGRNR